MATLDALRELALGRRVRAWNRLCRLASQHPDHYRRWRRHSAPRREAAFVGQTAPLPGLAVTTLPGEPERLVDLLSEQAARGMRWLVPVLPGDRVGEALAVALAAALVHWPDARILYWDEDWCTDGNGRDSPARPWIKPDWDPLLHMARDCLGGASAIHIQTALAAASRMPDVPATATGLAELQFALLADGLVPAHVPLVLSHRAGGGEMIPHWPALIARHWPGWQISQREDQHPFLCVVPPDPAEWPSVTIIVPTRDRADLLRACLKGLARLTYPGRVQILVVDNGSRDAAALELLAEAQAAGRLQILRDDGPFNFARLNNRAADAADSAFVCLFNNDVEALDGEWLAAMMRHAARPGVGAVGAQLLYPDGRIQHAGVAVGTGGAAGHVQRGVDPASLDHAAWHAVSRQVSVVTAACLLVATETYKAAGGLDERGFAVAFNDVDFCLKLRAMGLSNIYCAESRLVHAESRTRPDDRRPDQQERFNRELALLQQRWGTAGSIDPHHSPLFSPTAEPCLLSMA